IKPHFRNNDYEAGLTAGVNAILAATKGEYKGSGRTVVDSAIGRKGFSPGMIIFLVLLFIIILSMSRPSRGRYYITPGWTTGGWGGWSSGGGFSGGGGGFGGGGAGGNW